jgi:ketosteroid isomerase-like protein
MTSDEQLELVNSFYSLSAAGDHAAAGELLTEDFSITIPSYMPFAGVYQGKDAFRKLIPIVVESIAVSSMKFVATTVGDDHVVKIVEFTLNGHDGPPIPVVEVTCFRGNLICEIRPYYHDARPMIDLAARRKAAGITA